MKKELKIRKDEPLYKWCDRIAKHYHLNDELREVLGEVSKESYIQGTHDALCVLKK